MRLKDFNRLSLGDREFQLHRCCGAVRWVKEMIHRMPFDSLDDVQSASERSFANLGEADWLEAFNHHPAIGDVESLRHRFSTTASWAALEQSEVQETSEEILHEILHLNKEYRKRFGYIFIINATGRSAEEILYAMKKRIGNKPPVELSIAAAEQRKITDIRLKRLLA